MTVMGFDTTQRSTLYFMCQGSFPSETLLRPRILLAALMFSYVVFLYGFSVAIPESIVFSEYIARSMLCNH